MDKCKCNGWKCSCGYYYSLDDFLMVNQYEIKKECKPRVDLVAPDFILSIAKILAFGAEKHGERAWEEGMDWSSHYAACQRHLLKWFDGESTDPETGKSHLHHAATRLMFLCTSEAKGIGRDDRPVYNRNKKEE